MREKIPSVALSHDRSGHASVFWMLRAPKEVGERLEMEDMKEVERDKCRGEFTVGGTLRMERPSLGHLSTRSTQGSRETIGERRREDRRV